MLLRTPILFLLAILAPALVIACSGESLASRQDVLASVTDELIVPRFQAVAVKMGEMRDALDTLCANPNPGNLVVARTAWRDARAPWLRSQAMWFGPVMDRRSRTLVDWSPIDPERIEATLAKRESVSSADAREFLGSTQRGLGAIEYVIFGQDAPALSSL